MKLKTQEVEHIAKLARLGLTEDEKKKFQDQISSILGYVEKLQKVDTKNVEPTAQVTGLINAIREDEVEACDKETMKKLVDVAPMKKDNLVKTKAIFE
ncbi:MAG: Asp-tRNA(Asn)/Glu-tRNA(Gln) amidotransferase subunit GatC [Patescibacteria group bacterium]|nr:Asp-tRNA(Asn)/Glu-tRNA(Gln) amidotransferase subunit GatC [Patescibacteria group bacterium]